MIKKQETCPKLSIFRNLFRKIMTYDNLRNFIQNLRREIFLTIFYGKFGRFLFLTISYDIENSFLRKFGFFSYGK